MAAFDRLAIGLSSGTSADAIDAALVALDVEGAGARGGVPGARGVRFRLVRYEEYDYPPALREAILRAAGGASWPAADFARLDSAVGEAFADAARRLAGAAGVDIASLDFIASHGQTVAHVPAPHRASASSASQAGGASMAAGASAAETAAASAAATGAPGTAPAGTAATAAPGTAPTAAPGTAPAGSAAAAAPGSAPAASAAAAAPSWDEGIRATWQLGSLAVIAERTGVRAIGNFRARDVAAGGEGAPLLPYVDYALFRSAEEGRMLLNIGGIANVTFLPRAAAADDVAAFDLGPGNILMDTLVSRLTGGLESMDRDGRLAASGHVSEPLLEGLMRHPFFDRAPPRSTGREEFGLPLVDDMVARGLSAADLLATACAFTARAISRELVRWAPVRADGDAFADTAALAREYPVLYASGGGAENRTLCSLLSALLAPVEIRPFDELGVSSHAREAFSFAVLGNECLVGAAGNLPRVTGARRAVVLGEIVPA